MPTHLLSSLLLSWPMFSPRLWTLSLAADCSIILLRQRSAYIQSKRATPPAEEVTPVLLSASLSKYVARMITIVWKSAVPPTLCAVSLAITYAYVASQRFQLVRPSPIFIILIFAVTMPSRTRTDEARLTQSQSQMWCPTLQGMIGKLYILSLLYNLCVVAPNLGYMPLSSQVRSRFAAIQTQHTRSAHAKRTR
ncbi:hypothetical protein BJV78DRAFT_672165 [Lactifluus subvellereus]|nr:hypothetical protein BJV78DRAFT_672165 [Lactifluus subvellereus]